jgi:hypothetical protein
MNQIRKAQTKGNLGLLLYTDYFNRMLPYAIALGVAPRWSRKFEGVIGI